MPGGAAYPELADLRAYMQPLLGNAGASNLPAPSGPQWAWDEDAWGEEGGEEGWGEEGQGQEGYWQFGGQQQQQQDDDDGYYGGGELGAAAFDAEGWAHNTAPAGA